MSYDNLSGTLAGATTKGREWLGWFGSIVWVVFMMYGFNMFLHDGAIGDTYYAHTFMALALLSIAAFSWLFGNDPNSLSKIAFYTTPIAIIISAVFVLIPSPFGYILYAVSPILIAPAMTRRIYGVIRTAEPGSLLLTRYISGVAVCFMIFTPWYTLKPPKEIAFLIPALLAVPAWFGVRRELPPPDDRIEGKAFKAPKRLWLLIAGAVVFLWWFALMNGVIHNYVVDAGIETKNLIIAYLGFLPPTFAFILYGIISDKGHERAGFICGMGLCILGILLALLPGDARHSILVPLAISSGLGGAYIEFFMLTIPIFFLKSSKRPVFTASIGVMIWLSLCILAYTTIVWAPNMFAEINAPVLVSTAISAILFILFAHFLFERYREKTLAAALYALLRVRETAAEASEAETPPPAGPAGEALLEAGFTAREQEIALLLIEGDTRRDISRKLHISAAEVGQHINAIKGKVGDAGEADPVIAGLVKEYKLTKRETDMLRCVMRNMGNDEIAAEFFLSEETVKVHMRNLIKKLPVKNKNRAAVRSWVEAFREKTE